MAKVNSEQDVEETKNVETQGAVDATKSSATKDVKDNASQKSVSTPTIAPPKDSPKTPIGQLPKIAPPAVAPPKEQPKEAVPPPPPNPKDGDFITISGTIDASNPKGNLIRIDIFDGDQRNIGGKRPSVVVSTTVDGGPEFEIFLPKKDQQLWVGAYIDEDGDGRPGPLDPSGWYEGNPISGASNKDDIVLTLGIPNDAPP